MRAIAIAAHETCRPASTWTAWGQWLALATMSLDHLTRYVLPSSWQLDWVGASIGRIAFPLFAAMVAWHGLFNTRNPQRYARRILIIGLVAQLPYMMMPRESDGFILNVCFTLAAGLAGGAWWRELVVRQGNGELATHWAVLGLTATLVVWYLLGHWVEYGHNGLLVIPLLMFAMHHLSQARDGLPERLLAAATALPLLWVAGQMNTTDMAIAFTVATCLAVLLLAAGAAQYVPRIGMVMPRWLWLAWYPSHFALIATWLWLVGRLG